MKTKKWLTPIICIILVISACIPTSAASNEISLKTTLTDGVQRGSKKTFDVWARNSAGNKIRATVKLNGQKVDSTWNDNEKTSYTLTFTQEGENTVTVSASGDGGQKKELTYHITYQKAAQGEAIGTATWSVEMFSIGCGYLVYPVEVNIYEGETAAEQLLRLLHDHGFLGYYGGTVKSSFYLAYIADGNAACNKYNGYQKSETPADPKLLNLCPSIPSLLVPFLENTMTFYDPCDYENNWKGFLGEFAFTNGSGWMYCVNNIFPNVGFADYYLNDGDVVRVQFTLGYGADIGGFGAMGTKIPDVDKQPTSGYYPVADKDDLCQTICITLRSGLITKSRVKTAYESALSIMQSLDAPQDSVNKANNTLLSALANPGDDADSAPQQAPVESHTSETVQNVQSQPTQEEHADTEIVDLNDEQAPDIVKEESTEQSPTPQAADSETTSQIDEQTEQIKEKPTLIPVVIVGAAITAIIIFMKRKTKV